MYLTVDKQEEEDDDEIDIYTFLRTSCPPAATSEDLSSSEDDYNDPYPHQARTERSLSQ